MLITLNGEQQELSGEITLAELVRLLGRDPDGRGVAVALNGEVVPRTRWTEQRVPPAAEVEVVNAVGGG